MVINKREVKEIHKLLKKTIVHPDVFVKWCCGERDELIRILKPLEQYIWHHYPDKLFRFRTINNYSLDALENDSVYMTRADLFNDPYDGFLSFDAVKMKCSIADNLSDEKMERVLSERNVQFPMGELFKTKDEYLKDFRKKRADFLKECSTILPNVTVELQRNTYVASLTENIASPVMWAHYAKNHSGFAIEYQFREEMFSLQPMIVPNEDYNWYGWRSILPVFYSNTRADGTMLASWLSLCKWFNAYLGSEHKEFDMSQYLTDLLLKTKLCLQKSEEWSYEREWRLMISHNWPNYVGNKACHLCYPPSGIYLGDKISKWDKRLLFDIAKAKKIPVYQMYLDQAGKEYKMEYKPAL